MAESYCQKVDELDSAGISIMINSLGKIENVDFLKVFNTYKERIISSID